MCESVDFEGQVDVFLCALEDGLAAGDAGVVDEDGGVAEGGADLGAGGGDGGGGGEVAFEEADGGGRWALLVFLSSWIRCEFVEESVVICLPSYVSSWTSNTATFMPLSASKCTTTLPIPSLPPVTTTTSLLQTYVSWLQLFVTASSSHALRLLNSPSPTIVFKCLNTVLCSAASMFPRVV
jgi:hypothetical protein